MAQVVPDKILINQFLNAAHLQRLKIDLSEFYLVQPAPTEFIPAPAQGVLAWQIRENDSALYEVMQKLNSTEAQQEIETERKILELFNGGCQIPIGVFCKVENGNYHVWVSHAMSWDAFPKRVFIKTNSVNGLAENAVEKVHQVSTASVFITRDISEQDYFFRALNAFGYKVFGSSLIETKAVDFREQHEHSVVTEISGCDWIFFSSKNGVNHFFAQQPQISANTKFGVTGQGTAMALRQHGFTESFCGTSTDMEETAKQFAEIANGKKVLFPQAEDSLQSIQKQLTGKAEILNLIVYKTIPKSGIEIPTSDITVFTSPSNVAAYFANTGSPQLKNVIAIGKSTEAKLHEHGITNVSVPSSPDETGLAEAVFSLNN